MNPREAAYKVLNTFMTGRVDLEKAIDITFSRAELEPRDKRLCFEIIYGVIRNQTFLDFVTDKYLDERLTKEVKLRMAVKIALYQFFYLDRIPVHAAVNESVNLMKLDKSTFKFSGAVNGILRTIDKNRKKALVIPDDLERTSRLAIEFSHPEWLIDRWIGQFGSGKTKKLLKSNNDRPSVFLRWNSTMIPRAAFEADIASLTETAPRGIGFNKSYYQLKQAVLPGDITSFKAGACTVQAPSSGWPVAMLDIQQNDIVLDVASAPGGKTTLMAELIGDEGVVVACDSSELRLKMVSENMKRMDLENRIIPVACDGEDLALTKYFDKVLLDAPCSGTGVMQRHPESRWIRTEKDIQVSVKRQKKLLESIAPFVKKGGVLVYSTCSLEREENWDQVEQFLENHPDFELEDASDYVESKFVSIDKCLAITPQDHGMDGMFAARLVKKKN